MLVLNLKSALIYASSHKTAAHIPGIRCDIKH